MTGIIASFRKTRPEGVVKKRQNSSAYPEDEFESPPPTDRPESATSWASRKDSLGDSLSISELLIACGICFKTLACKKIRDVKVLILI